MNKLDDLSLSSILPDNLLQDPDIRYVAKTLDKEHAKNASYIDSLFIFDPETLPHRSHEFLNYLLKQEHVDFADEQMSKEEKARAVYISPAVHARKGTAWAVAEVVNTFYGNAEMKEWYQYGGDPYHFKVRILDSSPESERIPALLRMIFATKNERSVLEGIFFEDNDDVYYRIVYDELGIRILPLIRFYTGMNMPGLSYGSGPSIRRSVNKGAYTPHFSNDLQCGMRVTESGKGTRKKAKTTILSYYPKGLHHPEVLRFNPGNYEGSSKAVEIDTLTDTSVGVHFSSFSGNLDASGSEVTITFGHSSEEGLNVYQQSQDGSYEGIESGSNTSGMINQNTDAYVYLTTVDVEQEKLEGLYTKSSSGDFETGTLGSDSYYEDAEASDMTYVSNTASEGVSLSKSCGDIVAGEEG